MSGKSSLLDTPSPPAPRASSGYEDVDRLRNANGLVAVISQRRKDGELTFAIHREWVNDGKLTRGAFVPESMVDSYLDLVTIAKARMQQLHDSGSLPFPCRIKNGSRS